MDRQSERSSPAAVIPGTTGSSVLHARAVALAARGNTLVESGHLQVLVFAIGEEVFAIETMLVSEVCPIGDPAPIPGTPGFVLGIVSVRGRIVSVLDLMSILGVPEGTARAPRHAIVLQMGSMEFAIAADNIKGVRELSRDDIEETLSALAGTREEYVIGVTPGRIVVLDAAKMLSDPRLIVTDGVHSAETTMGGSA